METAECETNRIAHRVGGSCPREPKERPPVHVQQWLPGSSEPGSQAGEAMDRDLEAYRPLPTGPEERAGVGRHQERRGRCRGGEAGGETRILLRPAWFGLEC